MKATKLLSLAIPVLLLVGCGVGDKDSIPKTEETSKAMLKTVISEKQYPYYICEQLVEFQFKKDEILLILGEASKDNKKYKDVFKTANDMDEALDRMENIIVPDKDDGLKIQEAVLKSSPHMSGVDGEQWREAIYKLNQETKDAYAKALDKRMEEHTK
ncbi:hypothetical protein COL79_24225 [Bacillus pseudomycoides]|uniref:hypothetical protein n=1 Tax=Bacillus pseudomycoides TaxID=64104 RepID=UPI000BF2B45F|nr:hypothetical protein [Bacillus pseudomycoides]PGA11445.1 hypothetical protein COL79_24225 [Bacillus pseudomycoides]